MTTANTPGTPGTEEQNAPSGLQRLRRREGELWRTSLFLLVLLASALAYLSWDKIRDLPWNLEALPVGLVVLVFLFVVYIWRKSQEIAGLRGLVQGFEQRAAAPPDEKQLQHLLDVISRSQQGYRDLIDNFDDLLFSVSLDGTIRAANRSFAELVERPFTDLIGRRLDEFIDDPRGNFRRAAERALPKLVDRRHWSGVVRVPLSGNRIRYFDCLLHAMVKGDVVTGLSGLARDVTQLRESETRFTELFETLQEGVYFAAPDGKLLDANPALVHMLGYTSKEELLGVQVNELSAPGTLQPASFAAADRNGSDQGREITLPRKDGRPVVCLVSATAIRDSSGRVVRYQGTLMDITHRREMEKRLHQEQEFARRLVDSFPDLIVVLDTQGRYTFVSSRITETLGYQPEELLNRSLGERTNPEDRKNMLSMFEDVVSGRQSFGSVEYRTLHKRGDWRTFRAVASPLFDAEGNISGVVASSRDVTEVKRLEQQLIQSEKLVAMGQMIAGVAHELNNPLTAILGVTELLRERATEDASRRQLELAHRQARRAAQIVQNLLAFSRPPAPRKTRLDVTEVLQRSLQLHEHSLRTSNVTVEFAVPRGLPAVVGDANQLMQVFLNLITNAEQAVREVRDHGTLRILFAEAGSNLQVLFEDDGVGVPPDVLPRIFDPFFTTKRPGRGTGLGLSISMAIVREHGGNIEAQPLPTGGSRFTVSLPVSRESRDSSAVAPAFGDTQKITPLSLHGRSLLLVDDEESISEMVRDGLTARGMRVDCARTAEQALEFAARNSYDSILCDLHLSAEPGGKKSPAGRELLDHLQAGSLAGKTHFIMMTGDLVEPADADSLSRRGIQLIQKPFRISELIALLGESLIVQGVEPRAR